MSDFTSCFLLNYGHPSPLRPSELIFPHESLSRITSAQNRRSPRDPPFSEKGDQEAVEKGSKDVFLFERLVEFFPRIRIRSGPIAS